jgi:D-alanyl-D-alanine carboxypeptidase (penicillin-binding protein 5/6)
MNIKWKRLIEGVLLSFVPLFLFVFFVYGSQIYLLSEKNVSESEIFLGSLYNSDENNNRNIEETEEIIEEKDLISNDINANAVISVEVDFLNLNTERVIFEKNADLKLPIASLTKLMTALISFENYNLSDVIVISDAADLQPPMKTDFKLGDAFSVQEFINVMLIESSNKAALALSEKIGTENFIFLMNKKAKELGLKNTFFTDPTGISSKNVSTVKELIILVKYILNNYLEIAQISTIKNYELDNLGKITNTNQLLMEIPNIILSKTGFTNYANGCLLLILNNLENNKYLINIILGADDRFLEMRRLINWENIIEHNN